MSWWWREGMLQVHLGLFHILVSVLQLIMLCCTVCHLGESVS
jgi:hypothetical protein